MLNYEPDLCSVLFLGDELYFETRVAGLHLVYTGSFGVSKKNEEATVS